MRNSHYQGVIIVKNFTKLLSVLFPVPVTHVGPIRAVSAKPLSEYFEFFADSGGIVNIHLIYSVPVNVYNDG